LLTYRYRVNPIWIFRGCIANASNLGEPDAILASPEVARKVVTIASRPLLECANDGPKEHGRALALDPPAHTGYSVPCIA